MEKVLTSPCKGMNCGCADGVSHSLECHAEHAAAIAGGYFVKAAQPPHAQPQAHDDAALAALGWQRISCPVCGADGARAAPAQPQAQTTSPDDIHSCGEFCDLPECVAAREAQAQGERTAEALTRQFNAAEEIAGRLMEAEKALAQHRAALEECVVAMKKTLGVWGGTCAWHADIKSAITHANQVLEGGGK